MKKKKVLVFGMACFLSISGLGSVNTYAHVADYTVTANSIESAIERIGTPYFTAILVAENGLTLNSGGRLTCASGTETRRDYNAGITMELQSNSNGSWGTIKTWSDTSSTDYIYLSKDWYVVKGTYRLKLTHTAKNTNGTIAETFTNYSRTVVYN